jgi:hypothetical protein
VQRRYRTEIVANAKRQGEPPGVDPNSLLTPAWHVRFRLANEKREWWLPSDEFTVKGVSIGPGPHACTINGFDADRH